MISGVGQQPAHNAECRAFIVGKILEDANASTAARQQVDNFYSKEAQDQIRTQRKRPAEQATGQATEPSAMQTETTATTGAGKLPVQKRKADKEAEEATKAQKEADKEAKEKRKWDRLLKPI